MTDKPRIQVVNGQYRLDAWQNSASGMGMAGIDKTVLGVFGFGQPINRITLAKMYRYDWLARKICEKPAKDAVRRWITIDDDRVKAELERLCVKNRAKEAISWGRLFGGAALVLIVEDGLTPADPLRPERVTKVVEVKVIDRHYLQPHGAILDPYSVGFGKPEFYTTNNGTVFHHSRVMKFTGASLTEDEYQQEQYWGGSYVELYNEVVKSFQGSMQDVRHIMTESSIGQLSIPDLTNSVAMGGSIFDAIQKRLDAFNQSKSIYRTAAMDKEETFDFKNRQLTGLSDLIEQFKSAVGGATEMGDLVLFGTSPSGLNSSQEEQLAVYYDMVRSIQEDELMYALNTIISCINKGVIPEWDYKPLQEPTDAAKADVRLKEAQAIQAIALDAALQPDEIRNHLNETGHFNLVADDDSDFGE